MKKTKKKKNHKCEDCGYAGPDVKYLIDPYAEEIHHVTRWQWICDKCYQESLRDI